MDETNKRDESEYLCMLCGMPVLREGSECFDCRRSRPAALRLETKTQEKQGAKMLAKTLGAVTAVGVAVFLVGIADLGSPEIEWTVGVRAPVRSMTTATGIGIVVGTERGAVLALDELSGKKRWKFSEANGAVHGLTVREGHVYFTVGDSKAYAVDLRTGGVVWEYRTGVTCEHVSVNGDLLVMGLRDRIVAVERRTGNEAWSYRMASGQIVGNVLARDNLAWYSYAELNDASEVDGGGVGALNVETRVMAWETDLRDACQEVPVLALGTLVVVGKSGRMYGLDARKGEREWQRDGVVAGPVVRGEAIFVAERNAFVGMEAVSGAEAWTTPHELTRCGAAVLEGASVFFVSNREIRAVRPKTGSQRWAQEFDDELCDVLAFGGGWMYVATKLGQVCALRMP